MGVPYLAHMPRRVWMCEFDVDIRDQESDACAETGESCFRFVRALA